MLSQLVKFIILAYIICMLIFYIGENDLNNINFCGIYIRCETYLLEQDIKEFKHLSKQMLRALFWPGIYCNSGNL
jgi:hypothetical protein